MNRKKKKKYAGYLKGSKYRFCAPYTGQGAMGRYGFPIILWREEKEMSSKDI